MFLRSRLHYTMKRVSQVMFWDSRLLGAWGRGWGIESGIVVKPTHPQPGKRQDCACEY